MEDGRDAFNGLHWLTAGLFLAAGAETTFGARRGDYRDPDALRWAPLVAAPLAGAAHAARAIWPSDTTRRISQILNGVAVGVGTAGLANSLYQAARERADEYGEPRSTSARVPSFAPLAFGAVGLLGFLLNNQEEREGEERAELRRFREEQQTRRRQNRIRRIVLKV